MDVKVNNYRPATIASTQRVNQIKKVDNNKKVQAKKETPKIEKKFPHEIKPGEQRIDTYAAYRKRKYAERIKTRFDLFI